MIIIKKLFMEMLFKISCLQLNKSKALRSKKHNFNKSNFRGD